MITEKEPVILELGARLGGNCLPDIMHFQTGVDTVKQTILMATGEKPAFKEKKAGCYYCVKIIGVNQNGVLNNIKDCSLVSGNYSEILEIKYDCSIGDEVKVFNQGSHRIGHVIYRKNSIEEVEKFFDQLDEILKTRVI
ncbi:MAG: hypothetical protein ACLFQV_02570 [Vulcanimicrobiota bacterium]